MKTQNNIIFQEDGSPFSTTYNDIYFDTTSGCQQSIDVFIDGNNIKEKLLTCNNELVIAETGFGTGLNFLLTLQLYQQLLNNKKNKLPTLTFISVEKFPLTREQISHALQVWPSLKPLIEKFLVLYPKSITDKKVISLNFFNNKVKLTVYFDDAKAGLAKLAQPKKHQKQIPIVDAWYLDGFAPTQNPDMWSPELFQQIQRLSKPQASIATFTVSGFVRRQLLTIGFRVYKKITIGKKKESLVGVLQQANHDKKGYQLRPKIHKPQTVSIIGGGIASACAAYALAKEGIKVTLYCQDEKVAQGASGNLIGALYPLIHQQKDDISLFFEKAFWHAKKTYQQLLADGYHFAHQWCGVLELSYKENLLKRQQQFEQINAWSTALIKSIDNKQASKIANIPLTHGGLFMPEAGWISPPELVNALITAAKETPYLTVKKGTKITTIKQLADKTWQLQSNKENYKANVLVVCGGAETTNINIINQLPIYPVRGQVSNIKANNELANLSTVICHKGYLTPAYKNRQCIGATFEKNVTDITPKIEEDQYNLTMLKQAMPEYAKWTLNDIASSKARLRCMTPDHLPMVGAMPNIEKHLTTYEHLSKDKNWQYEQAAPCIENLFVLTGLGARGLCTAPLLADILAADLTGKPYPVDDQTLFNLAPNRFVIRDIIKRKI